MKTQGIKIDEGAVVPTRFASEIRLGAQSRVFWWKSVDLLDSKGVGSFGEDSIGARGGYSFGQHDV
jgi:hypothetical protein